jgi:hypothetical protein
MTFLFEETAKGVGRVYSTGQFEDKELMLLTLATNREESIQNRRYWWIKGTPIYYRRILSKCHLFGRDWSGTASNS